MEGTRHEKVSIVVASYAIGFVTAFILYGNLSGNPAEIVNYVPDTSAAAVITATPEAVAAAEAQPEANTAIATYTEGVLQVEVNGSIRTLSHNPETSDLEADLSTFTQGYHYGEITFGLSPDNKFVFFCERHDAASSICTGYVYDIAADQIHQIAKDGQVVTISAESVSKAEWTTGGLAIGGSTSANPTAPWILIDKDSALDLQ